MRAATTTKTTVVCVPGTTRVSARVYVDRDSRVVRIICAYGGTRVYNIMSVYALGSSSPGVASRRCHPRPFGCDNIMYARTHARVYVYITHYHIVHNIMVIIIKRVWSRRISVVKKKIAIIIKTRIPEYIYTAVRVHVNILLHYTLAGVIIIFFFSSRCKYFISW